SFTDADFDAAIGRLQKGVDKKQIRRFTGNDYMVSSATGLPCDSIVACTLPSPSHATVKTVGRPPHAPAETTPLSPTLS
ncbi:hypothetical protein ABZ054_13605, partial [Streptomyces sp. NPDC006324]